MKLPGFLVVRAWLSLMATTAIGLAAPSYSQQIRLGTGSVVRTVTKLKAGQFVWAPQAAPDGPMLMIVNLSTQRALLFRNGVPIGATTVSTGKTGHGTPTGVFTILEKQIVHHSSKYDNAPMPYMERLTWQGVALHAGRLPGYPASHGCIRLPAAFAKLLYGSTKVGMTVVITEEKATPRIAPAPEIVTSTPGQTLSGDQFEWHPERSPQGPLSIVVSGADERAIVLRNGVEIGAAPVKVDGLATGTWAYTLRKIDAAGQQWIRLSLDSATAGNDRVSSDEWERFHAPEGFRRKIGEIVQPGTTVVVTSDSLSAGAVAAPVTVMDATPTNR